MLTYVGIKNVGKSCGGRCFRVTQRQILEWGLRVGVERRSDSPLMECGKRGFSA
ncbi:hypothetical protein DPMN_119160 [Dreissena polymorpha]|uniref:Uncharacterized protein n=1 Tax=Dreissena polymorpha TaxID=45954 RepID=A0A9D4JRQ8_DREPO|nr:hypothetical protein DPMN_119160 [Dreissena polymorpha]